MRSSISSGDIFASGWVEAAVWAGRGCVEAGGALGSLGSDCQFAVSIFPAEAAVAFCLLKAACWIASKPKVSTRRVEAGSAEAWAVCWLGVTRSW